MAPPPPTQPLRCKLCVTAPSSRARARRFLAYRVTKMTLLQLPKKENPPTLDISFREQNQLLNTRKQKASRKQPPFEFSADYRHFVNRRQRREVASAAAATCRSRAFQLPKHTTRTCFKQSAFHRLWADQKRCGELHTVCDEVAGKVNSAVFAENTTKAHIGTSTKYPHEIKV